MTSNNTKSSIQAAFSSLKASNLLRSPSLPSRNLCAASRSNGSLPAFTSSKSILLVRDEDFFRRSFPIHPRSASRSRLTSNGLPAKAELAEYGESPRPGGGRERISHKPRLASARNHRKAQASGPRSPIPPRDRSDVGCSRIPEERDNKTAPGY